MGILNKRKFDAEIEIDKPIGKVFGFVSNMENMPLWSEVSEVRREGEGRYTAIFKSLLSKKEVPLKITEYKSPELFAFSDNSQSFLSGLRYELEPITLTKTKIKVSCGLDLGIFSLSLMFGLISGGSVQHNLRILLKKLKTYLEPEQ